jgi:hypothetical protein
VLLFIVPVTSYVPIPNNELPQTVPRFLEKERILILWASRAKFGYSSMLILDSFRGHTTEEVKKILKSRNTDQVIIPGGLTSMLQPLGVHKSAI